MSKEFIQAAHNKDKLELASSQEAQLSYFTQSKIQDNYITEEFLTQWLNRQLETSDYFLNHVKGILKPENFLAFFKYLRFPLPSTKIINNKILPDLKRVFHAEDSYFNYGVTGVEKSDFEEEMKGGKFDNNVFDSLLFRHNSIVLTDLERDMANSPFREFVKIDNIQSLEHDGENILRFAYECYVEINGQNVPGFLYVDNQAYIFYTTDFQEIPELNIPHDRGQCPAHFLSSNYVKHYVVRQSIFTHIRYDLEEYVFLKTLQRMTEPNGAIPITTYLKLKDENSNNEKILTPETTDLMSATQLGHPELKKMQKSRGKMQAGTMIGIDAQKKNDGTYDMDMVKNFINNFYIPVESLKYLDERIKGLEKSIIGTVVGDATDSVEQAKNELQIEKSLSVLENTLRYLAENMARIKTLSDRDWLALKYGPTRVQEVSHSFGTDFFLESPHMLYEHFAKAPNPIERKNILVRISQNRYKGNHEMMKRQELLYHLLPYPSDKEFGFAQNLGNIDPLIFDYQTRFSYWIQQFEANFGDLYAFFVDLGEIPDSQKYTLIDNLIRELIKSQQNERIQEDSPDGVQGSEN